VESHAAGPSGSTQATFRRSSPQRGLIHEYSVFDFRKITPATITLG
jgi:hypothetical protein